MKAVILAGGLGTRAKPFTDYSPKPMIPIDDRPTIDYIVRYLAKSPHIDEIVIICNMDKSGHGNQIRNYFDGKESILKKRIVYVEDKFEGTGGAILRAKDSLKDEKEFLVWFSDNLCAIDIEAMIKFHRENKGIASMAVSKVRREETGFVKMEGNLITKFREKPFVELKDPESLAIYIFNTKILQYIEKEKEKKASVNLSFDVLQNLPGSEKLFGFDISTDWIDVESPIKVDRNIVFIRGIIQKMKVVP
jgi:mannose-1-phosphate guanylyltransferase